MFKLFIRVSKAQPWVPATTEATSRSAARTLAKMYRTARPHVHTAVRKV